MKKKIFSVKDLFQKFMPGVSLPDAWTITGYADKTENVPEIDPNYLFTMALFRDLANWWEKLVHDGLLLFGPPGCGKTAGLRQFSALLNIPLYEKTVYKRMRFEELVATTQIIGGTTVLAYGPMAKAMGAADEPGILLLNEAGHATDGVLTGMNEVLQGNPIDVRGQETIGAEPGFRVAMTSNTGLMGDRAGVYRGEGRQNIAVLDRCMIVQLGYPDDRTEMAILQSKVPGLPAEIAKGMIDIANNVRSQFMGGHQMGGDFEVTISTRSLIRWAQLTLINADAEDAGISPIQYALDRALLNVASPETVTAITKMVSDKFQGRSVRKKKAKAA